MTPSTNSPKSAYAQGAYRKAVINSALWAAAGDALGWMTELSRGEQGVKHRTGQSRVTKTVRWKRKIGGRFGTSIPLPAGTYSDDTQLRLSISRSIRGDGLFDVEAFAKVELPVWQSYSLGAGLGSMAAAHNLSKRSVNWFSNFYSSDRQTYVKSGGNGAAMRIQPHVWAATDGFEAAVRDVVRDAIVTHGHPHGFCGAVFHAACLWETLVNKRVPSLSAAESIIQGMKALPKVVEGDGELSSFWKPKWESESGMPLTSAIEVFVAEAIDDLEIISEAFADSNHPDYAGVIEQIGCLSDRFRGSGYKTALAALFLAQLHEDNSVEAALIEAANVLDSDTDTIATMAGAILGALQNTEPNWELQDREYLVKESERLASIALGVRSSSFTYPDIASWEPPENQSSSVSKLGDGLALAGFGVLSATSKEFKSRDAVWQWFDLPFGQSVLAKRRLKVTDELSPSQLPAEKQKPTAPSETSKQGAFDLAAQTEPTAVDQVTSPTKISTADLATADIDVATDLVIKSGFDDTTIGQAFNSILDRSKRIEDATAFAAIIAKAKIARARRS